MISVYEDCHVVNIVFWYRVDRFESIHTNNKDECPAGSRKGIGLQPKTDIISFSLSIDEKVKWQGIVGPLQIGEDKYLSIIGSSLLRDESSLEALRALSNVPTLAFSLENDKTLSWKRSV